MKCLVCYTKTRVVVTEHRTDGVHRWRRCPKCGQPCRTIEVLWTGVPGRQVKPGPKGAQQRGEANHRAVLTTEDVRRLRQRVRDGHSRAEVAKEFGIAPDHVTRIYRRRYWAHVP